ncbi:MAG TPA: HsdR family type I site-specific deoxyribonuclease [Ignavibacteria bacterium]|nr:HsdR family type I site-specific deoxyribonuclease [Ignavibacteria bacterium]
MNTPSFKEDHISQIPAIQFLIKLGYNYITPDEAYRLRYNKSSNVILDEILIEQLRKINRINYKGKEFLFSESNILSAVEALKSFTLKDGLIRTNENVYDLLTLGKSFEQIIEGDRKSFNIKYIDWENFENNILHVSEEFDVQREKSDQTYRPDIVLFVNGIPLVVIECKRPDLKDSLQEAISQQLRNQHDEGIQKLYIYSQLLLSLSENEAKYATTGTSMEFWAKWKEHLKTETEKAEYESVLSEIKNRTLENQDKDKLFSSRFRYVRDYFESLENENILVSEQDKILYDLCRPERLLDLIYKFIVYDAGEKKIARYQQFFTVKNALNRIRFKDQGKRLGGVVWHTQGSGKSITMVMLAKSIALDKAIRNPRIILVTDRIDLDDQIYRTFRSCGKEVTQAKSGRHLMKLVNDDTEEIITTLIDKFEAAVKIREFRNESSEIFVLIDEAHRSQYGFGNIQMLKVLPNACFIGFTGTPIMKKDKNTIYKFGGLIEPTYTINTAVEDKAVVPLLYEGRHAVQVVDETPIDTYFELVCKTLNEQQKADLKRKYASADHLNEADQKIYRIAWDISTHFKNEWHGTGFKAQLATSSKNAAMKYKEYLDEIGLVDSEVLISPPDDREGYEDIDNEPNDKVLVFWKNMMKRFGNDETYNKQIINAFKKDESPEVIIVVDKLLTGFDAPRNTVLYIAKNLKEHNLLQAIARVNRLCEGKDFGYIIDYYGILGNLDQALTSYGALADFDENDLENTLESVNTEIEKLPELHAQLWDIFKTIRNRQDVEAYEQLLADDAVREIFYKRVSDFVRTLKVALSTLTFVQATPNETIDLYRNDAKMFLSLRASVQKRYSDKIEYKQYEAQIQRLIDTHITSSEIMRITDPVNIFETERFQEEVEKAVGTAAKADMIATRTQKAITAKMDEDPAFYKRFSELLAQVIADFRAKRISDAEYLTRVKDLMQSVVNRTGDELPAILEGKDIAKAYYGICLEILDQYKDNGIDPLQLAAECGIRIDEIISSNMVVDFHSNNVIQNLIRQEIDDYLYSINDMHQLSLTIDQQDTIIERSIEVAKHRY